MTAEPRRSDPPARPKATESRRPGLPARSTPAAPSPDRQEALALARRAVELASDKKAADIVLLEVADLTTIADYFVICSGASERQLGAVADGLVEGLEKEGLSLVSREGGPGSHWLLLDFGAVIVHVMAPPERDYYQLERLWADAPLLLRVQ